MEEVLRELFSNLWIINWADDESTGNLRKFD